MKEATTTIFRAAAVRDAAPGNPANFRPGAVAVRGGRIVAVGEPGVVEKEVKEHGPWRLVDLPDRLILPAMVNAHAHLDLTDIGPVAYEDAGRDFIKWIEMVMKRRPQTDEAITAAVRRGLRMSREAGVGWIGDIAGSDAAVRARINAGDDEWTGGISYVECFGIGKSAVASGLQAEDRLISLRDERPASPRGRVGIQLQPHAPYSAGLELYRKAHNLLSGFPSTHLAETTQELEFVRDATGPFSDLLKRLGKWDETLRPTGLSPVEYLRDELEMGYWVVAHCNYVSDRDIAILAKLSPFAASKSGVSGYVTVAYCPIASEYFGHRNHRYRDMLRADVNVCLGTDSIICQRPDDPQPLGIISQMRRLHRRDQTDPRILLEMATWRGETNPGYKPKHIVNVGLPANLISVHIDPGDPTDALVQALLNDNLVEPLNIPKDDPE